ncbi:hypothetical protein [Histophilus somni]|uniref:hypothetical protein n=1 Tax=Histophilus somni TaxID=731 RepID=UPI00201F3EF9|nr:hypothetical protein [Histophilus somni]
MTSLVHILDLAGMPKVAEYCGVSLRAAYKWRKANTLPRTEYTGETNYANAISEAINGQFSSDFIREVGRPKPTKT